MNKIKTIDELYVALDELLAGISTVCTDCHDEDCKGYMWLLPVEADVLFEAGVSLLEVNDSINFINPFSDGQPLNIEQVKPSCSLCLNRLCTIHQIRPLVCRLYPLNFVSEDGKVYLVLHLDCPFANEHQDNEVFKQNAIKLIQSMAHSLFTVVIETFKSVDDITKFPDGSNRYLRLACLQDIRPNRKEKLP
ncbi:MAG: hypothetical protein A2534_03885 [Candidatus Magasanikbacteria bacterium RIFOXYD2_FULL_39_9]|nr:MAG: hypothetical protein A2534_03885 [Candidatus Magasanikbacteria bacterium RIFOXYD2_FULL_39_9]